jgi:hypothetical protein
VAFNKRGAFDNLDDTEAGLRDILGRSFRKVEVRTVAGTAIFVAADPLAAASDQNPGALPYSLTPLT